MCILLQLIYRWRQHSIQCAYEAKDGKDKEIVGGGENGEGEKDEIRKGKQRY